LDFCALLVPNAVLYVRPAELIPALSTIHLDRIALAFSVAVSLGPLLGPLRLRSLGGRPVSACVVGLIAVAVSGQFVRLAPAAAFEAADPPFRTSPGRRRPGFGAGHAGRV
jgi:hypothetical protein